MTGRRDVSTAGLGVQSLAVIFIYLHNMVHHQSHSGHGRLVHNKNLSSTRAFVDRFAWYSSLHTNKNACTTTSHVTRAPPTQRCERSAPHSADYVRQKTRQQNVLRADGQHDEQQRLEAHNVAFRADGECAAARVTRSTRSAGEQAIAPDKPVRVGAQATVCDAVDFRVQAQYAVQHLLLLNSRLHVQLQLVNHSLKVPECGKGLVRKRSQLTRTGETVRVHYWDRAILARSRRSDAVITD